MAVVERKPLLARCRVVPGSFVGLLLLALGFMAFQTPAVDGHAAADPHIEEAEPHHHCPSVPQGHGHCEDEGDPVGDHPHEEHPDDCCACHSAFPAMMLPLADPALPLAAQWGIAARVPMSLEALPDDPVHTLDQPPKLPPVRI